ncbi:MAG: glycoside hydrolase family 99-like domain-containing protein [Hyphomicrobiales bacterium]|nr:glycoside hydrolase family 99-like domain-containing protein [Hyphomicrobiales bacterium]
MSANALHERVIAFYLPQFHPIPENNEWWGQGFTEWTNVAKAKPLYPGHEQPRLPADLGFYDLRVPETRAEQARMARASGIEGFCYWHYWFGHGRRILERPFDEVLGSGAPSFPFCLAWANQSWTGIWHGNPSSVLIEQKYPGPEDERAHFDWALKAFRDPRYMTVNGKPIFCVFAPHDMPSTSAFTRHWRQLAADAGLPGLYLVAVSHITADSGIDPYRNSVVDPFDAVTHLTPLDYIGSRYLRRPLDFAYRWKTRDFVTRFSPWAAKYKRPVCFEYADVVERALTNMPDGARFLPQVIPNWDNTPRSGQRGTVYMNSTPELFGQYLSKAKAIVKNHPKNEAIIFVKAWNEWAEGNYLEPDLKHGHGYLDVMREVLGVGRSEDADCVSGGDDAVASLAKAEPADGLEDAALRVARSPSPQQMESKSGPMTSDRAHVRSSS